MLKIWLIWHISWFFSLVLAQLLIHFYGDLWFSCIFLCSKFCIFWLISSFFNIVLAQILIHFDDILIFLPVFVLQIQFILTKFTIFWWILSPKSEWIKIFLWFHCIFLSSKTDLFWYFHDFSAYFWPQFWFILIALYDFIACFCAQNIWFILTKFMIFYHSFGLKFDSFRWRSVILLHFFVLKIWFALTKIIFSIVLTHNQVHIFGVLWVYPMPLRSISYLYWPSLWFFNTVSAQNLVHFDNILWF